LEHDMVLIEDCCEAHGATIGNITVGTFGDIAVYSMRSEKMIGIGEGGMVSTSDEEIYNEVCFLADDRRPADGIRFWARGDGYNFNMCEIQGAVGLAQVEQFDEILKRKIHIGKKYMRFFKNNPYFHLIKPMEKAESSEPVYWLNALGYKLGFPSRDDVIRIMIEHGNEMRPAFYPANRLPAFQKSEATGNNTADSLFREILVFPSNVYMTDLEIEKVCRNFVEVLDGNRIK